MRRRKRRREDGIDQEFGCGVCFLFDRRTLVVLFGEILLGYLTVLTVDHPSHTRCSGCSGCCGVSLAGGLVRVSGDGRV